MNSGSSHQEELGRTLASLQSSANSARSGDPLEAATQELQGRRVELEMQNRALREMQAELEAAVQRYADLYDHLPVACVTLTPTGQIVQANLTAARWLRRDRAQLPGVYMNWFLDAFDAGRFAAHLDNCVRAGGAQPCELTLRLGDGLMLKVQLTSRLMCDPRGGSPQVQTAMAEISKLAQARLMDEEIAREKAMLAELVTADTSEPPATVSGYARALLSECRASMAPGAIAIAERLERAAVRMECLLLHLIDFSNLGHTRRALDPVNLEEVVQHVIVEHRSWIEEQGTIVEVARPLPCVRGSRLILAQVLGNLLMNALHCPTEQRPSRFRIEAEERGDRAVLKISDDGSKLPRDERQFRVFERLHGSRQFLSEGVGFALVRRAIEAMNGRVWLETRPDGSCCFHIELQRV